MCRLDAGVQRFGVVLWRDQPCQMVWCVQVSATRRAHTRGLGFRVYKQTVAVCLFRVYRQTVSASERQDAPSTPTRIRERWWALRVTPLAVGETDRPADKGVGAAQARLGNLLPDLEAVGLI